MRRSVFLAGVAGTAGSVAAPLRSTAATTVRIGYVDSFSGPLADIGAHHRRGAELAVRLANQSGRTKYELLSADDNSKPSTGATEARRLIAQENVDVLLLGTSSAVTLAVGPLAQQAGVFTLAIGAQDTNITGDKANRVLFRFAPNVQMQIEALAQRILSFGKNWYFIVDDFAYGKDGHARLGALLRRAGGTEVGADVLALGTADYSSSLTKLRNSNADVLVLCQGGFDAAKTAQQFVSFGLHKKIKLAGTNMEDYYWKTIPSDALVGSTFAIHWTPTVSDSAARLARRLQPMLPEPISSRDYFGYLCTTQLIERMNAAGTTKAEALVAAFRDHRFDAAKANPATWRACDHQCAQDEYAGAVVSDAQRRKTGFMFEVVGELPARTGARACGEADASAAAGAIASQTIPERTGYTAKTL
ncbi:MAG TPA: ABC transporter substrate-binding protein [Candidatus Elarobacter sp.]|jgi:branched-chain amino acid transport system substrate-binding protein|nr:ABC transporter substrate-binding protein [Candidatus Elarobacter sp.]